MRTTPILLTISEFAISGVYSLVVDNVIWFLATVILAVLRMAWRSYTKGGKLDDHLEKLAIWYLQNKNRRKHQKKSK